MKLLLVLALVIQATIIFSAPPQNGGVYKIVPKGSGQLLGIPNNNNAVGADLVSFPDQNTNYQRFQLQETSPGTFYIQILGSGLYVSNYISPPRQAGFNPDAFYQDYQITPATGGYYTINPVENPGNVMTRAPDGSLSWQPKTGADNQLFFFCSSSPVSSNMTSKFARLRAAVASDSYEGLDLRS